MRKTVFGIGALVATAALLFSAGEASAQRFRGGRGGTGFGVYSPGGFGYGSGGYYGRGWDGYGSGYSGWGYNPGWGISGRNWGIYGDGYRGGFYSGAYPGYNSYYYDASPSYGGAYYDAAPAPSSGAAAATGSLQLEVHVPAPDAKVWVNGQASTQRGTTRYFTVSEIAVGRPYRYEVRAEWMQDGKPMSQTRAVTATAGETAQVVFTRGATTGGELRDRELRDRDLKDRDRDRKDRDRIPGTSPGARPTTTPPATTTPTTIPPAGTEPIRPPDLPPRPTTPPSTTTPPPRD
jgi:uncharacterized protein (TIGR03000 family)